MLCCGVAILARAEDDNVQLVQFHRSQESATSEDDCPPWSACPTVTSGVATEREAGSLMQGFPLPSYTIPIHHVLPDKGSEMLVAVNTAPGNEDYRNAVRNNWFFPENVAGKFIVCADGADENLQAENTIYKDILILPCSEGYTGGKMTTKVYAAMDAFLENYSDTRYFFRVDDDSIPNIPAILRNINDKGDYVYAGLMYPAGTLPVKDNTSRWYEPEYSAPYPASASGRAGYVLSKALVSHFVRNDKNTTMSNMLWNEDQAIGVWVDKAKSRMPVNVVELSGTDGYDICKTDGEHSRWLNMEQDGWEATYSGLILKHHLSPSSIQCLVQHLSATYVVKKCVCDQHDSLH
jgi:hypothetical protein